MILEVNKFSDKLQILNLINKCFKGCHILFVTYYLSIISYILYNCAFKLNYLFYRNQRKHFIIKDGACPSSESKSMVNKD